MVVEIRRVRIAGDPVGNEIAAQRCERFSPAAGHSDGGQSPNVRRKMFREDPISLRKHDRPFDVVLKLTNVSRPDVILKRIEKRRIDHRDRNAILLGVTLDEDERAYQQALAESLAKEEQAESQRRRRERGGLGIE